MPKVLLDSSAYIDLQRARKHAREGWAMNTIHHAVSYRQHFGKPCFSTLAIMEVASGIQSHLDAITQQDFQDHILSNFEIIGFDLNASCLAGEIYAKLERAHQRVGITDTGMAAIAICHDFPLVTSNIRHFSRIQAAGYPLHLINWREA